jgi:hypothetical protein
MCLIEQYIRKYALLSVGWYCSSLLLDWQSPTYLQADGCLQQVHALEQ